jgi:FtsP/CotA-like multicopper oxidase with cupredoxin domain
MDRKEDSLTSPTDTVFNRRRMLVGSMAVLAGGAGLAMTLPGERVAAETPSQTREFTLVAEEIDWELQPGTSVKAWTYNGEMPGPEIRVTEGDLVRVTLRNNLPVGTTIHWHGVDVPPAMDGPVGLNQAPVEPGESFTYEFIAKPAGTRWYHSHADVAVQVALGLYGQFIVEPKQPETTYDRDYTVILAEWDSHLTPAIARGDEPRSERDRALPGGELGTDLFLMNGKMHEAVPPIVVSEGDKVLIRLVNAGAMAHPFHIHGHSFKIVATDGNPVPPAAQWTKDTVLVGPGERYDLAFDANNPGVWMVHCHIENHADNGMMTVIQYEGALPSGPAAEGWDPSGNTMGHSMHGDGQGHGPLTPDQPDETPEPQQAAEPPEAVAGAVMVSLVDNRFKPAKLTVPVGTTVTWVNEGGNWHNLACADAKFRTAALKSGESYSHRFDEAGSFRVVCTLHARQGMTQTVEVTG